MNHRGLKKKALADPGVRAAYEALEPEFKLLTSLIEAREQAGSNSVRSCSQDGYQTSRNRKAGVTE